jgi:hypothetical protein
MNTDRHTILSLVAMGRITPREAERLLAVWPGSDEAIVRLVVCLAFAWLVVSHLADVFAGFTRMILTIAPQLHHSIAFITHCFGGLS